jgi:hypothetical protein
MESHSLFLSLSTKFRLLMRRLFHPCPLKSTLAPTRGTIVKSSQPRIDLIWNSSLRESRPVPAKLVACARHSKIRDDVRVFHHVDQ